MASVKSLLKDEIWVDGELKLPVDGDTYIGHPVRIKFENLPDKSLADFRKLLSKVGGPAYRQALGQTDKKKDAKDKKDPEVNLDATLRQYILGWDIKVDGEVVPFSKEELDDALNARPFRILLVETFNKLINGDRKEAEEKN